VLRWREREREREREGVWNVEELMDKSQRKISIALQTEGQG
jgi:hypothetical protein